MAMLSTVPHSSVNTRNTTSQPLDMPPPYWGCVQREPDPQIDAPSNPSRAYTQAKIDITEPKINREQIQHALDQYIKANNYQGKLKNISLGRIAVENVFKYTLITATEMRSSQWKFVPYISQSIPGPSRDIGDIWDIVIHPPFDFTEGGKTIVIPGTASIVTCEKCLGEGRTRCVKCLGLGTTKCVYCGNRSRRGHECYNCDSGKKPCDACGGESKTRCELCLGHGQVLTYLELTVSWKVQRDEFISDEELHRSGEEVPKKKLHKYFKSRTIVAFTQTQPRLYPIENFPNTSIQNASRDLLEKHDKLQSHDMIIRRQRHTVEVIQISSINYRTKAGKTGVFRTYGDTNHVYFPDYPKSRCSIL